MNEVFLLPYGFKLISQSPTLYLLQPQQHYQSTNIYSTKHIKKTYLWTAAQLLLSSSIGYKNISRFYVYATIVYPPALMILFPFSIEDLVQDALAVSVSGPYPMLFPDILLLCVNGLVPYSLAYRIFCLQQDSQDLFLWQQIFSPKESYYELLTQTQKYHQNIKIPQLTNFRTGSNQNQQILTFVFKNQRIYSSPYPQ